MAWKLSFRQNYLTTFPPTVPTSATGISHVVADVEAPDCEKWEHLKSGGKQWQATPKNLPRMQRTRAIPVAGLNSGLCPEQSKGWITTIIIIYIYICKTRLASNEIFSPSNKIHQEVGWAKDLSALLYILNACLCTCITITYLCMSDISSISLF